jgi:uncharacterized protein (DUF488 family)
VTAGDALPSAPPSDLLTIGYEGCTIQDLLSALAAARVTLLIDVRALPRSRKPGFSKRQLAAGLDEKGIPYVHLQALGTPKAGRDAVRAGHPEVMEAIFRDHMTSDRALADLGHAKALAREVRACLLCFEHDAACCHRRIVAEMIAADTGQTIVHLGHEMGGGTVAGQGAPVTKRANRKVRGRR